TGGVHPPELGLGPVGDALVARLLGGAIGGDEGGRIGRAVVGVERSERRVGLGRIEFIDDRGVHPVGQYGRAALVGVQRHVEVGRGQGAQSLGAGAFQGR